MHFSFSISTVLALAASHASAVALPRNKIARGGYPFDNLVAFGDELSDNGNGSFAHGISGPPANVYGFGTWTNGPTTVQYLAGALGVPLASYAFGSTGGGATIGATIDNSFTESASKLLDGASVPSVHDQIYSNYTQSKPSDIGSSLQFIWTGQNDLTAHTDALWESDPKNAAFANTIAQKITADAEYLIEQGAANVFVANIYPKHRAPVAISFLCHDGGCLDAWGKVIESANEQIKTQLAASKYADKFIYYDVFAFMNQVMDDKDSYGFTMPLSNYCDGSKTDPNEKWDECVAGSYKWEGAEKIFWMNYVQPSAHANRVIAADMKKTIDAFFKV